MFVRSPLHQDDGKEVIDQVIICICMIKRAIYGS